jgi:hypothetical protein
MPKAEPSPWRAIWVKPQMERAVADSLRGLGVEALVLWERRSIRHAKRVEVVKRAVMSRYAFAALDGDVGLIHRIPGALDVVRAAEVPLAVPQAVIRELQRRGDATGLIASPKPPPPLAPGARMPITGGTLQGLLCTIIHDAGPKVRVWIDMLGGKTRATVARADLTPKPRPAPKPTSAPTVPSPQEWDTRKRELLRDVVTNMAEPSAAMVRQMRAPEVRGVCPKCEINLVGSPVARPRVECPIAGCPYAGRA